MHNKKEIRDGLRSVLDAYKKQIGNGWFTRHSRKVMVRELENALQSEASIANIINLILTFSWSMQGDNADVGFFGQSKLHSMLWGNNEPFINVYQMMYDGLKKLQTNAPQHEILSQIQFPAYRFAHDRDEEKPTALCWLTRCFQSTDKHSSVVSQHADLQSNQEPKFLEKLMRCIGYNWKKNKGLKVK